MELSVNTKRKNLLQKKISRSKKSVYVIASISKFLIMSGLIGGTLYIIINFISPSLSMVRVNGVFVKNTSFILITSSLIYAPCLIFGACLNVLSKNLGGVENSARVDESLLMDDTKMHYSFRFKYQDLACERKVIIIDYSQIDFVNYDEVTGALDFKGKILVEFYDDYIDKKPVEKSELDEWIIYDYFTPSLKEILEKKGVKVNITNWGD